VASATQSLGNCGDTVVSDGARDTTISHEQRVEGLRNLRTGYGTVQAAVGFWKSLHGEDLIEVYADIVEKLDALEGGCCTPDASDDFCARCPNGGL
jgi:hypothetical protein